MRKRKLKPGLYEVRRTVLEVFEVETDEPMTREQISSDAMSPHTIVCLKETVKPKRQEQPK